MRIDIWVIECVSVVLFGWALVREGRNGQTTRVLLIGALVYGLVLELLNMSAFEAYRYNSAFTLQLFGAPLTIGIFWALILVSSMKITDALGVSEWAKPFSDGALCVLVDLGMEVVAVRLGYWTWNQPLNEGFFGVPASNFYAWIFVGVCFSVSARVVMHKGRTFGLLLIPGLACLLLLFSFVAVRLLRTLAQIQTEQQQFSFFIALLLICLVCMFLFRNSARRNVTVVPPVYAVVRIGIHLYFLLAAVTTGLYRAIPSFLLVSLAAFTLEVLIHVWVRDPGRSLVGSRPARRRRARSGGVG